MRMLISFSFRALVHITPYPSMPPVGDGGIYPLPQVHHAPPEAARGDKGETSRRILYKYAL